MAYSKQQSKGELPDMRVDGERPEYEKSREGVDEWLKVNKYPSPTGMAMDFGIDPSRIIEVARREDWLMYGLYRLRAYGESSMMFKVYGAQAYLAMIEGYITGAKVEKLSDHQGLDDSMFEDVV